MVSDMNYSNSDSTSFFNTFPLLKFFKYSLSARTVLSNASTTLAWQNLLKSELDDGSVVFVKGDAHFI
jgi:hypothetical protein